MMTVEAKTRVPYGVCVRRYGAEKCRRNGPEIKSCRRCRTSAAESSRRARRGSRRHRGSGSPAKSSQARTGKPPVCTKHVWGVSSMHTAGQGEGTCTGEGAGEEGGREGGGRISHAWYSPSSPCMLATHHACLVLPHARPCTITPASELSLRRCPEVQLIH